MELQKWQTLLSVWEANVGSAPQSNATLSPIARVSGDSRATHCHSFSLVRLQAQDDKSTVIGVPDSEGVRAPEKSGLSPMQKAGIAASVVILINGAALLFVVPVGGQMLSAYFGSCTIVFKAVGFGGSLVARVALVARGQSLLHVSFFSSVFVCAIICA